jgi:sec-independent protein translocase protein TatB
MGSPPPIQLATLGMWDTLLLMVLALVVFGPRRLPMIGRQLGKLMYEFRKASNDFKFQMEEELRNAEEADRRKKEEEERQRTLTAVSSPPQLEQAVTQAAEPTTTPESTTSAPAATESPYPSEPPLLRHPDFAAEATRSEETTPPSPEAAPLTAESSSSEATTAAETAVSEAVEAAKLRIQPPSTGEPVPAERPGQQPQRNEPVAPPMHDPGETPESVIPAAERSEPATRHG